jgi:hypothetical protein
VPPVKIKLVAPETGANVPPQVSVAFGGVSTIIPLGNVSVNPTPVNATVAFGFVIVKLSTLVPFIGIVDASKPFMIDGGPTTVRVAVLLVAPVPLSVELIVPVTLPERYIANSRPPSHR